MHGILQNNIALIVFRRSKLGGREFLLESFNWFVSDLNVMTLKDLREWLSNAFNIEKDRKVLSILGL